MQSKTRLLRIMAILSLGSCILHSAAFSADANCSDKNNEIPEMGQLRNQRVTNQKENLYFEENGRKLRNSVGWCYAYAAADLVSFKLKRKVSAADIAINYN